MSNIALYNTMEKQPDALAQVERMGLAIGNSGMFGCKRVEQGIVLAMACVTTGMNPLTVAQRYHIIEGKLQKKTGAALHEFMEMGGLVEWLWTGQEPDQDPQHRKAVAKFTLNGRDTTVCFTMEDARNAGLVKSGSAWQNYPWKMLRARVIADALGMIAPGIFYGDEFETIAEKSQEIQQDGNKESELLDANPPIANSERISGDTRGGTEKTDGIHNDSTATEKKEATQTVVSVQAESAAAAAPPGGVANVPEPAQVDTTKPAKVKAPDELVDQVRAMCRNDMEASLSFLVSLTYLEDGQGLEYLNTAECNQLLSNADRFLSSARESVKASASQ